MNKCYVSNGLFLTGFRREPCGENFQYPSCYKRHLACHSHRAFVEEARLSRTTVKRSDHALE